MADQVDQVLIQEAKPGEEIDPQRDLTESDDGH